MHTRMACLAPVLLCVAASSVAVPDDDVRRIQALAKEVAALVSAGRKHQAREKAGQLTSLVRGAWGARQEAIFGLADMLSKQGQEAMSSDHHRAAETLWIEELEIRQACAECADRNLASYKQIQLGVVQSLQRLGDLYRGLGRYAQAAECLERALAVYKEKGTAAFPLLNSLAEVYRSQGQLDKAKPLYDQALAIAEALPGHHPDRPWWMFAAHMNLGVWYYDLALSGRQTAEFSPWQEADRQYGLALNAFRQKGLADHPWRAQCFNNQGRLYHLWWQRLPAGCDKPSDLVHKADRRYQQALLIFNKDPAGNRSAIIDTFNKLAALHYDAKDLEAAHEYVQNACRLLQEAPSIRLDLQYNSHYARAKISWANGQRGTALNDLRECMRLALEQRVLGSGTPYELAGYFTQMTSAFERMVDWQTELAQQNQGDIQEAFSAIERSRAQVLLDQMRLQGTDLLAGVPQAKAEELCKRQGAARAAIASLEQRLRKAGASDTLKQQLAQAKDAYRQLLRDIAEARPIGDLRAPLPLEELRQWAAAERTVVLEYLLGAEGGYLLIVPGDGSTPRLLKLMLTEIQTGVLGGEPGPLTAERLRAALTGPPKAGLLDRLANKAGVEATDRLHALWQALVPKDAWDAVTARVADGASGRLMPMRRIVLIPDGPLALLPFEALVVRPGRAPAYVLDVAPPVVYTPSANVLLSLARSSPAQQRADAAPVLSVAKKTYADYPQWSDLPYAVHESNAVADAFKEHHIGVRQLTEHETTEARVRAEAADRRILHLCCHGYSERERQSANLSSAMFLTIGPGAAEDASDDGRLTPPEIERLDLKACDLAILSACESNLGPDVRGEGVWALSRSFLVAGARRVVATGWQVDDNAAAQLIARFASGIAHADNQAGSIDYAYWLHEAKRYIRNHAREPKWKSPYYWSPFILTGSPAAGESLRPAR